jgi:hypothetical protein
MPLGDIAAFEVQSLTTLTATGVTSSIEVLATAVTFQVTASGLGTNVVIRMEGSLDDAAFFPLYDATRQDTTITANGTYGYTLYAPVRYIRLRLVSISGGTPTIATKVGAL